MEDVFDRFFRDWSWPSWTGDSRGGALAADMVDGKDEVIVRMDMPGLSEKEIDVTVESGVLTVRGQRKDEWEDARDGDYDFSERWTGTFARSLTLPTGVDPDRVKATLKKGVLEIRLPKVKEALGKRVEVQAA